MDLTPLYEDGWLGPFDDPDLAAWVQSATPAALQTARNPDQLKAWLRHGGTWYAGVNALPNDGTGSIGTGPALHGGTVDALQTAFGPFAWDAAQISGVYPSYPKQDPQESDAAHAFRKNRAAAHVDGLVPQGPERRRYVAEPHGFVLGLPVTECDSDASPMVVWKGSHHVMRKAFQAAFANPPVDDWAKQDITDVYTAARRTCFETCERHVVHAKVGQAYLVHRLALHGVLPWKEGASAAPEGRVILYFRPECPGGIESWLNAP